MSDSESARANAKRKVGQPARDLIGQVRRFAERAWDVLKAPEVLRESARQQVQVLTGEEVDRRLREQPISALRNLVGKGTRIGSLEKHGYETVGRVRTASPYHLSAVPNVGPSTAYEVKAAADRVAAQLAKDAKVRLDPDRRTAGQTHLLATLAAIRHGDSVASSLREPLEMISKQAAPLVAEAEPTTSKWRMFGRSAAKRMPRCPRWQSSTRSSPTRRRSR